MTYPPSLRYAFDTAAQLAKRERLAFHNYDITLLKSVESEYAAHLTELRAIAADIPTEHPCQPSLRTALANAHHRLALLHSINAVGGEATCTGKAQGPHAPQHVTLQARHWPPHPITAPLPPHSPIGPADHIRRDALYATPHFITSPSAHLPLCATATPAVPVPSSRRTPDPLQTLYNAGSVSPPSRSASCSPRKTEHAPLSPRRAPSVTATSHGHPSPPRSSPPVPSCITVRAPRAGTRGWAALPMTRATAVLCGALTRELDGRVRGPEERGTDRLHSFLLHGPDEAAIESLLNCAADAARAAIVRLDARTLPRTPVGAAAQAVGQAFRMASAAQGRVVVVLGGAQRVYGAAVDAAMRNVELAVAAECARCRDGVTCVAVANGVGEMSRFVVQKRWPFHYYVERGVHARG